MSNTEENRSFRDHIGTVDKAGKRVWLYPIKPKGKLYNLRTIVSIFQIGILVGLPFVKIDGNPALLFNVLERKLFFFGFIFRPQDSFLLALLVITFFLFIVLFTVIFGRIWCGWLCPQTVFMEMVFRKIEYWIEGDSSKQKTLNSEPWHIGKLIKKLSKYSIFYILSFIISNIFLAYIIGVDSLFIIITDPPMQHINGLIAIIIFSLIFYGVFAWFREQACLVVCPYGRLQSVMQDSNTMMVSYDHVRGEPRGKATKNNKDKNLGDCVDCNMCVKVCPTGIDIRNGLQMECVNCTACIDSCNDIMTKLSRPKGLIRYASADIITNKSKFKFSPKIIGYMVVLFLLISINVYFLQKHSDFNVILNRVPGMLYQKIDENHIGNVYDIVLINNSFEPKTISFKILSPKGEIQASQNEVALNGDSTVDLKFLLILPKESITSKKTPITIGIFEKEVLVKKVNSTFLGPENKEIHP